MDPLSASPSIGVSRHTEFPPVVGESGGRPTVTFAMSVVELIFVIFAENAFKGGGAFRVQDSLITIQVTPDTQASFRRFVTENLPRLEFTEDQINVLTIVSNIWERSKTYLSTALPLTVGQEAAAKEIEYQNNLDAFKLTIPVVLQSRGLVGHSLHPFTLRQANLLMSSAEKFLEGAPV